MHAGDDMLIRRFGVCSMPIHTAASACKAIFDAVCFRRLAHELVELLLAVRCGRLTTNRPRSLVGFLRLTNTVVVYFGLRRGQYLSDSGFGLFVSLIVADDLSLKQSIRSSRKVFSKSLHLPLEH